MKPKLSVAMATFNEEQFLDDCLDSVREIADEIVIADGSSTDATREIAEQYDATVIKTTNKPIFHINKQMAVDECTGDWILQLDADERVSPELAAEIRETISRDAEFVAYRIKRKNFFLGTFLKKGGVYPDPVIRLFVNGRARLPCKDVHEQFEVDGPVGWLENDLVHLADPSFARYIKRNNRYTTLMAQELMDRHTSTGPLSALDHLVVKPLDWFFKVYIRHKGFQDGFPGFVFAFFSALRFPISYIKYWEFKKTGRTEIDSTKDWL